MNSYLESLMKPPMKGKVYIGGGGEIQSGVPMTV